MTMFQPATRKKLKLRMAIDGPSGSGKTYTALRFGFALGKRIVTIDTEHGSMSKYQGESPDGISWQWKVCELKHFDPKNYTLAMQEAAKLKPDVLIIDSLSHAWEGKGGALEQVEKSSSKNKYTAWKDVTPKHREMVEAILAFPAHVIVTMRSKMEHVLEENEKGKMVPRKVGMAPIQRPGTEYEFDIVGELDWDHNLQITKTRCSAIDGLRVEKPSPKFLLPVIHWLNDVTVTPIAEGTEVASNAVPPPSAISPTEKAIEEMAQAVKHPNAGGTPVDERYEAKDTDSCLPTQVEEVKRRAKAVGWSGEKLKEYLKEHGKAKVVGFSIQEADTLLSELGSLELKQGVDASFRPGCDRSGHSSGGTAKPK